MQAMTVISFRVNVPVLSEQMWVAPPMVSDEASFLTRQFYLFILAEANDREIVTASGSPSGIATTMTVMAMMTVSRSWFHNGFVVILRAKFGTSQVPFGGSTQVVRFPQPHGSISNTSRAVLTSIAMKVKTAQPIPTLPIFDAIASSFSWRRVGRDGV
jgi:hypothetical protein